MTFGSTVRQARENRGWSQDELARRVGVTRGSISHWELDRGNNLKVVNFFKLANVLDLDPILLIAELKVPGAKALSGRAVSLARAYETLPEPAKARLADYLAYLQDRYPTGASEPPIRPTWPTDTPPDDQ